MSVEIERKLLVTAVETVADEVIALTLDDPEGCALPTWAPGAHLQLELPSGRVRQYSLCGRAGEPYRIAVLRERDGRGGSEEIHRGGLIGRTLTVVGPRNHFSLVDASEYLFIAGGIGITPILAMVREVAARGNRWRLLYGGRTSTSMAFVDELMAIDPEAVEVLPQDQYGLPDIAGLIGGAAPGTAVYCCGPDALITAVQTAFWGRDDLGRLHVERFAPEASDTATEPGVEFTVECARSGFDLAISADESILDVVLDRVDAAYPHGCTEGFCGTCETKVLGGVPDHRDEILTDAERTANEVMMICVGRARSSRLILDI